MSLIPTVLVKALNKVCDYLAVNLNFKWLFGSRWSNYSAESEKAAINGGGNWKTEEI